MNQISKTKSQVIREKNEKIRDNKEKIKGLIDNTKKLNQYKPPLTSGMKRSKLERLNKLKIVRNMTKMNLYNNHIEILKLEISLLNL